MKHLNQILKCTFVLIALLSFNSVQAETPPIKSIKYMKYRAKQLPTGEVVPDDFTRRTSSDDGWYELRDRNGNILEYCSLLFSDSIYKEYVYFYKMADFWSKQNGKYIKRDTLLLTRRNYYIRDGLELRDYLILEHDDYGREISRKNYSSYEGNGKPLPDFQLDESREKQYDYGDTEPHTEIRTDLYYNEGQVSPKSTSKKKTGYTYKYIAGKRKLILKEEFIWNAVELRYDGEYWRRNPDFKGEWELESKTIYAYDDNGNEFRRTNFSYTKASDGYSKMVLSENVDNTLTFYYDAQNRLIEENNSCSRDGFEKHEYVTKYGYDNAGRMVLKEKFNPDSVVLQSAHTLSKIIKNKYDDKNNIIYQEQFDYGKNEKTIFLIEYTYNEYGHWIKKITWYGENDQSLKPYFIVIKELTYYEPENTKKADKKRNKRIN